MSHYKTSQLCIFFERGKFSRLSIYEYFFPSIVQALDPEEDQAIYSLVGGNELGHFEIGETSGTLRIADHLDRESLDSYSLVGNAEGDVRSEGKDTDIGSDSIWSEGRGQREMEGLRYGIRGY